VSQGADTRVPGMHEDATRTSIGALTAADNPSDAVTGTHMSLTDAPTGPGVTSAYSAAADAPHGPLMPGQNLGDRYHIVKLLGLGGMGAVYQAWDAELGVVVAVKVIRPADGADPLTAQALERRFKQELLLARQVTHRNVVRIHDLGEIQGIKYITMPYVQGEDLATILRREGKLSIERTLRVARSMVSGLAAAHAAGVVHRDLKPANIMIDADGEAMIMDFGIARSMTDVVAAGGAVSPATGAGRSATGGQTMVGAVVGTVEYMAPEQAMAEPVDQRADIYAFGLILYDLLLGRQRAKQSESALTELYGRIKAAPPPPHSIDPAIPEALNRIINRCVQPDRAARYQTTAELAGELEGLDDSGKPLPMVRRLTRRLTAVSVAVVLGLLGLTFWLARGPGVPVTHEPVSVLIADFNNLAQDKTFDGALEGALGIALEGASFITSYSRTDARKIATDLAKRSAIDENAARLVAVREGIKVILAGTISPDRDGYRIVVKGQNPDGTELWVQQSRARNRADVLNAVAAVASDIRSALGDTKSRSDRLAESESVTTSSLEALQSYTVAQELYSNGKFDEAVKQFEKSTGQDQTFGRAYAGLANAYFYLGRQKEAEDNWKKAYSLMDRMTEREKYRTQGTYFFAIARNYEKAIENYEALIKAYPTDSSGLNNLGVAYFLVLNFPKALEAGRRALELYPKNVLFRSNYALYAMYAGDFATATRESEPLLKDPGPNPFYKIYLPPAIAAAVNDQPDAAIAAYEMMARAGAEGASLASTGLADLAMYRGRYGEAEGILQSGLETDTLSANSAGLAAKRIMLAEIYVATGRMPQAMTAVEQALKVGRSESVLVPAARLYLAAGRLKEANELTATLDNSLQTQSRAYAKILDGNVAMLNNRRASAIDAYREAVKFADFWLARYEMGVTYARAGAWAEALSEFAACEKRRGEATALFLDDNPTVRYLATLPYWLGRAQEGAGQQAAARANYQKFLAGRGATLPADPLVIDARKRAGS
jgi:eukaryotic-like serine/threonine-protein kinase